MGKKKYPKATATMSDDLYMIVGYKKEGTLVLRGNELSHSPESVQYFIEDTLMSIYLQYKQLVKNSEEKLKRFYKKPLVFFYNNQFHVWIPLDGKSKENNIYLLARKITSMDTRYLLQTQALNEYGVAILNTELESQLMAKKASNCREVTLLTFGGSIEGVTVCIDRPKKSITQLLGLALVLLNEVEVSDENIELDFIREEWQDIYRKR